MSKYVIRRLPAIALAAIILAALPAGCASAPPGPPYSPAEALESFEIHPDFQIELFAAEPDLMDPVALDFGPDGRIWVAESSGYPLDIDGKRGRIKLLEDTDGDGRPDKTTLFADNLVMPTGVMAWKNGVLVTDAPDVLYLEDTDGDGKADKIEKILSGFAFTNPQHTVSSPVYGLDNWIYLSHEGYTRAVVFSDEFGDPGSEIHFPAKPDGPRVPVARRSVRFRPDTFELELLAGPSQFGQTFNAWGDLFNHNNSFHSRHEVIAAHYLLRSPRLRVDRLAHDIVAEGSPAAVYPITVDPRFEILSGMGQMTSACGLTRYLGGAFPGYEDLAVVAEPVHNIVRADRWAQAGATYTANRLREDVEFLASRDAWFRPVNFAIGFDGALYVVDYYRDVIEHPEWTSAETYESETLYDGAERGRIWRITPRGGLPFVAVNLADASDEELGAELASKNIQRRRTAQRLLVERQAVDTAPALEALAADGLNPTGQVHALWTLEGLSELRDSTLAAALGAAEPGVRKNALRLAEPRFREQPAAWESKLLGLGDDPDAQVRLQALLTLGEAPSARSRALRDRLLLDSLGDEWFEVAALTWPEPEPARLYSSLAPKVDPEDPGLLEKIAALAGREPSAVRAMLAAVERDSEPARQAAGLRGLRHGVGGAGARQSVADRERAKILALAGGDVQQVRQAALDLLGEVGVGDFPAALAKLADALQTASDPAQDEHRRADAIRLLALADPDEYAERFRGWIDLSQPTAVQAAAVAAYGRTSSDDVAEVLLEKWRELPGAARAAAAEALVRTDARAEALVAALEEGQVQPWMLQFRQRRRLIMHPDPAFRERARTALTASEDDRRAVVERYQTVLAQHPADASKGRAIFERVCKECHKLNGRGSEVGPDLATVRTRPALNILYDVLLPNQSIAQTYEAYVVETNDGSILDGVIGPQGPTFVTLRREGGLEDRIERSRITSMRAMQLSAMPGDLESQITPEQMADLIRFIKTASVQKAH